MFKGLCLSKTYPGNNTEGFLCFIQLIGTCYFKKYLSTFSCRYDYKTPNHLFNSIMDSSETMEINHKKWFIKIREVVATVINSEEERVRSFTSLKLHWLIWVMLGQHVVDRCYSGKRIFQFTKSYYLWMDD